MCALPDAEGLCNESGSCRVLLGRFGTVASELRQLRSFVWLLHRSQQPTGVLDVCSRFVFPLSFLAFCANRLAGYQRTADQTLCVKTCQSNEYSNGTSCVPCDPSCTACTSLTMCSACTSGNFLLNGNCSSNCQGLPNYYQREDLTCQPCDMCSTGDQSQYIARQCVLSEVSHVPYLTIN